MNKILLITGTRKGIGKQLAQYYLDQGYRVIGCSRGQASIEHDLYKHYVLDISDEKAVGAMIKDILKQFGRIDVLINNAGVASMNHIMLMPLKTAQDIVNTNFLGTFLLLREAAKAMKKHRWGRIVNFTSVAVPLKLAGESVYAASKSAIEAFTQISAKEMGSFGITVNAIGPNPVQTDLIKGVPREKINRLIKNQAIERFSEFKDVTHVIDFFIDEKSDFITGQVIYLGGIRD